MIDELRIICLRTRVHELRDDRLVALRRKGTHLRSRVFITHELRQLEQLRQIAPVPVRRITTIRRDLLDFLLRIVDQRQESRLFLLAEPLAEHILHLLADDSGAIVQYMEKGRILAVQVAHEMLRSLRQGEL